MSHVCVCVCVYDGCTCVYMLCTKQLHDDPYEFLYQFLVYPLVYSCCLYRQADYRTSRHLQLQESSVHVARGDLTLW